MNVENEHADSDRNAATARLMDGVLDLLVIGGGIVGAGVARDAAMRGLRVGLVEQHDFASGTSSRSSRLLHGGLRYLAQGRIGLVREASIEKRVIHRIAPHLASPMAFIFPTYRTRLGDPWAGWKLRAGVRMYDLLCGGGNFGASSSMDVEAVRNRLPGIDEQNLTGAVRYFDAFTNDARLVLDTLRSAVVAGASLVNYCKLQTARPQDGQWYCTVVDEASGAAYDVIARCVVNATGAWAQQVPNSSVRLRLTKGVHLVVDRKRLPIPEAVVMTEGRRILFAIPWGERVILGTTDTDYEGSPEAVTAESRDVDYILDVVNRMFPQTHLWQGDLISTWAGLRPLIADRGRPSDISRTHRIDTTTPGWWDVSGGKLTTYRLMAQQTVDRIQRLLGSAVSGSKTAEIPLLPPDQTEVVSGLLPPAATRRVVEHCCRSEWAMHLQDVMVRRTSWHHYRRDARTLAVQVSQWMAAVLGWSEDRRLSELRDYVGSDPIAREPLLAPV